MGRFSLSTALAGTQLAPRDCKRARKPAGTRIVQNKQRSCVSPLLSGLHFQSPNVCGGSPHHVILQQQLGAVIQFSAGSTYQESDPPGYGLSPTVLPSPRFRCESASAHVVGGVLAGDPPKPCSSLLAMGPAHNSAGPGGTSALLSWH